jgi:uncharacterized membrane protein
MKSFDFSMHVEATADRTFDVFTDLEHAEEMLEGVIRLELLTDGPVGAGTRFRETRKLFGKEASEEMEFTRFEPPSICVVESDSCGAHWTSTYTFTPEGDRTRVDLSIRIDATSMAAKLMSPLTLLFGGSMKKMIQKDLDELKAVAESGAEEPAPAV